MSAEAKPTYSFVFDKANDVFICSIHGHIDQAAWVPCWNGCQDGYFDGYEDDPLWYNPGDLEVCTACKGEGGWPVCTECNINNPDAEF